MRQKESWLYICDGKNFGRDNLFYPPYFKTSGSCESRRQQGT